jgi:RNAse (barnase) inhibitor barstar
LISFFRGFMSYTREKGWRDIGYTIGTMLLVSAIDLGGSLSAKLDACAKHDDSPRDKYRRRDIITAMLAKPARKTEKVRDLLTQECGPMLSIAGLFGGVAAGFYTASGIWSLLAGQGIAAGVAGLAAGIAAAPLAATAIGVGVSIVLPMLAATACFWPAMLSSGFREARLCRQYRKNPPKVKAPQAPKKPPLTDGLDSDLRIIGLQNPHAREDFFRSLRKRFPVEFNEAANLDANAPVLRGPVTVKCPLKFKTPAPASNNQQGGGA